MRRMSSSVSRREALRQLVAAGAGAVVTSRGVQGQAASLSVSGRPVAIAVSAVSAAAAATPQPNAGSLVGAAAGRSMARLRTAAGPQRVGDLIVRIAVDPV